MIQQLQGSSVVYQFYDMWILDHGASSPRVTQLPSETFITTIYTYLLKEVV